jgi:hypothetical protein
MMHKFTEYFVCARCNVSSFEVEAGRSPPVCTAPDEPQPIIVDAGEG